MNIRDLKYLVALRDLCHFGKAAEACCVSQPALSMQIKKLEDYLGVQLLERTNKSVRLTEQGIIIAERARSILNQVEEVREIAKAAKDPFAGEVKIGIFPTLAPYLLPLIIPRLVKNYPKLSFYLVEEKTNLLLEKLKQGKIDAALLSLPIVDKGLNTIPLFEEEFLLATPPSHPLAKLKTIKQHHLDHENLLLLEEGHCMRDQALDLCQRLHASEAQNFRATSLETLRHMVTAGVGITLLPKLACSNNNNISYIPFSTPKPLRTIGIIFRQESAKKVLLNDLSQKIKSILSKQSVVKIID